MRSMGAPTRLATRTSARPAESPPVTAARESRVRSSLMRASAEATPTGRPTNTVAISEGLALLGGPHAEGNHRAHDHRGRELSTRFEHATERARDEGQNDRRDADAARLRDGLERRERDGARPRESLVRVVRFRERRLGLAPREHQRRERDERRERREHAVSDLRRHRRGRPVRGALVGEPEEHVDHREPVGDDVVHPHDERAPLAHAVDEVHLPERNPRVERGAREVFDELFERAPVRRHGEREVVKVGGEVEVGVGLPARCRERVLDDAVTKARPHEEPLAHHGLERSAREGRGEPHDRGDGHGVVAALHVEPRDVVTRERSPEDHR